MNESITLRFEFVELIPEELAERTLYISMFYSTVAHKCCCGCGREVVTPLSPTDWNLMYDGVAVSLSPSVGNWNFPCRSHYWVQRSTVHWAEQWSDERIATGRAYDRWAKDGYFTGRTTHHQQSQPMPDEAAVRTKLHGGLWTRLSKLWPRTRG